MADSPDRAAAGASPGLRFPCANCHAAQTFDPVHGMLHCKYCGSMREVPPGPTPPHPGERSLADGLRAAGPPAQGAVPAAFMRCQGCGATVMVSPEAIAATCAFCGLASVRPVTEAGRPLLPDSVLPFCLDRRAAAQAFSRWLKALWLRPTELVHLAELEQLQGVYIPFWIFGARVESQWTAEAGNYYYVDAARDEYGILGDSSPRRRWADGEAASEDEDGAQDDDSSDDGGIFGGPVLPATRGRRRVRKTRWRSAHGQRSDVYRDVLVCASQGLQGALAERLAGYELRRLVPYADGYLAGFAAEAYAVELGAGHQRARQRLDATQQERCAAAVEGDTHRNLTVRNHYSDETFRYALLPVWLATYRYQGRLYRFVVSGQKGEVIGQAPYSYLKVAAACLLGLAVLALVLYVWQKHPELGALLSGLRAG